jgi:hypothetical protein
MKLFKKVKVKLESEEENKKQKKEIKEKATSVESEVAINKDDNPVPVENTQPVGLKSRIDDVNKKLDMLTKRDTKKEQKEFRLPGKVKRNLKKLALKNKVLILYLTRNRGMIPMISEIKDGFVTINGLPYNCSMDFVFLWKGKYPAVVIKEWDMQPVGTEDYYTAVKNNRSPEPVAIAMRMLQSSENPIKAKMSGKVIVFGGLAVIALIYIVAGGTQ